MTVVPRPHGPDAGEQSLKQELSEKASLYQIETILDAAARRSIRRLIGDNAYDVDVVGPPYLLYILLDNGLISKPEFCEATVEMIRKEGWTGYEVVKNAWTRFPLIVPRSLTTNMMTPSHQDDSVSCANLISIAYKYVECSVLVNHV